MSAEPRALAWRKLNLNVFASIPRAWIKNMGSGAKFIKTTDSTSCIEV